MVPIVLLLEFLGFNPVNFSPELVVGRCEGLVELLGLLDLGLKFMEASLAAFTVGALRVAVLNASSLGRDGAVLVIY